MGKKIWDNFEEYFLISSFLFVIPLLFLQIVMRYVFSNSLSWSEELARYIFLWQIWIGASYGVKRSRHIRIKILNQKLPEKARKILEIVTIGIALVFCIFLMINGYELVHSIFELGQLSSAMRMPMGYPYMSVLVGSVLMVIRYLERLYEIIRGTKEITNKAEVR